MGQIWKKFVQVLEIYFMLSQNVIFYSIFISNGNVIVTVTELLLEKCNWNCNNKIFLRSN